MRIGRSNLPPTPLVRCARALLAMLVLVGSASAAADSPIRSIEVAYDGETYVVNAVMFAPVGQAVAWEVLTDFDHVAQWVPNVAESKVLKREDASVTVQQRGVARVGAVSFPYVTERRIELKPPNAIRTVQLKGSLRRVESSILAGARRQGHPDPLPPRDRSERPGPHRDVGAVSGARGRRAIQRDRRRNGAPRTVVRRDPRRPRPGRRARGNYGVGGP